MPHSPRRRGPRHRSGSRIVVVGSINADLTLQVDRFPRPGETVAGSDLTRAAGGKGANQAVAAARAGAGVEMLGAVGEDAFGDELLRVIVGAGVSATSVHRDATRPTGVALITIDARGESSIVVSPGANGSMTASRVHTHASAIGRAGLVLLQREIPGDGVARAISLARRARVPVLLNPAPAGKAAAGLLRRIQIVVANETEAEVLLSRRVRDDAGARAAARDLARATDGGIGIVTAGARGSWLCHPGSAKPLHVAPHRVKVVDSTAAGDTFVGAFAARYLETRDPLAAARFASAAAALSVTKLGAIPSIPRRAEIEALLAE